MKKIFAVILTVALLFTMLPTGLFGLTASAAETYTEGYYIYTVSDGEVTIIDVSESISGDVTIPSTLGGCPVTSIGEFAFYDCSSLISITIGGGVTSIGYAAFYDCPRLTGIIIPDSVTSIGSSAFYNTGYYNNSSNWENDVLYVGNHLIEARTSISGSYTIKDGTITIVGEAFQDCSSLTGITIPDSVTSIGNYAFDGCYNLKEVHITDLGAWLNIDFGDSDANPLYYANNGLYLNGQPLIRADIPQGVTKIPDYAFANCNSLLKVTIPDSVTSIGGSAFYNCKNLTGITIPDSVTSIGGSAFRSCWGLTSITIGDGVTTIGSYAFFCCGGPTSITIPDSVTTIGSYAFSGYSSLTSITIGGGVTSIGYDAFYNCENLKEVHITDLGAWWNIDFWGSCANPLVYAVNGLYLNGQPLKNAVIPNGVTTIPEKAFYNCNRLESVVIPDSVTSIGDYAFYNCYNLKEVHITDLGAWWNINFGDPGANPLVYAGNGLYLNGQPLKNAVIPNGVTIIPEKAFYNCNRLESVVIPDSVTSIGSSAFYGCSALEEVVLGDGLMAVYKNAFSGCNNLTTAKYTGTQAQWNEVIVLDGNDALLNAIECDSGECAHQYAYSCSARCALCDQPRADAAEHTFTNACDTNCNVCGATRTTQHTYSTDCDTVCDICGSTRVAEVEHSYLTACDPDCNVCGTARTVRDHVFTDATDADCNICGAIRDVEVVTPTDDNAILTGPDSLAVGDTFDLLVQVADCPDATSVAVVLEYSDCFQLISTEWLQAGSIKEFDTNTMRGALGGLESSNINGNLFKITLKATKEIDDAQVSVQIIAKNGTDVIMDATATKAIAFGLAGDANGDNIVSDADATYLLMHTFFPIIYPVEQDCDFNKDGVVSDADAVYLLMYTFFPNVYPIG